MTPVAYSVPQVAAMYGVSESHIRRMVRNGLLRRVPHMGHRVVISAGELRRVFTEDAA